MLTFFEKYKKNVHSQNGEDGIIEECVRRINPEVKTACEFGCPQWNFCSNTALLAEQGWSVTAFDIDENIDARIKQAKITPENVNEIVGDIVVLSIDTDNDDYHIWKAYHYKPAIVIIEINSSFPPTVDEIPGNRGASFKSMMELAINKGYFLVAHTGNLVLVWNKYKHLFPEIIGYPIRDHHLYFNKSFL